MKIEYAVELPIIESTPASARRGRHFVHAFEAELCGRRLVSHGFSPVDSAMNIAEVKVTKPPP